MIARIHPRALSGSVPAISSKSMAHRLTIIAALADRPCHIVLNDLCADTEATLGCLAELGAQIHAESDGVTIEPVSAARRAEHPLLDCRESGSTLRFMVPVAGALGAACTFTGAPRLAERPMEPLLDELLCAGCSFEGVGSLPLSMSGQMRPGRFILPGNVSSQFISGIMMAAAAFPQESIIDVTGALESAPYVELTRRALACFGVQVACEQITDPAGSLITRFTVPAGRLTSPGTVTVEGDWSNAAFWLCAGALGHDPVTVTGLDAHSVQGDRMVLAALTRFGARVSRGGGPVTVTPSVLNGFDMSAQDIPDLVPVLSAVAAHAAGESRIRDCARLRIKESDRLVTTCDVIRSLGGAARIEGDDLIIAGGGLIGGAVDAHNDHRIAMMAAVAAVRCSRPVEIHGAEAVAKSYPLFFDHYRALGGDVEILKG